MANLTFNKIEGITAGSAFTVNAFASDKTVSAIVYFNAIGKCVTATKFTPKIGSVKVGGQNWLSTEIIKITYDVGFIENNNGIFCSLVEGNHISSASHQVSEKDGTVSSSVSMPLKNGSIELNGKTITQFAYKITVESTQNLVGCKVVMSDFQLAIDYTIQNHTISLTCSPAGAGVLTGAGTYQCGKSATISATPNAGYVFKEWKRNATINGVVNPTFTTNATYTFAKEASGAYIAVFEYAGINKIYIGTSQPSKIYVGTQEVKAVYVGTTKVYG